jgi:hypothetical protein
VDVIFTNAIIKKIRIEQKTRGLRLQSQLRRKKKQAGGGNTQKAEVGKSITERSKGGKNRTT